MDLLASLFFVAIGTAGSQDSRALGAIGGFFFGYFLMSLLRVWRRNLIIKNLLALRGDPEILETLRSILPDDR
jgi:hypothetical protein